MRSCLKNNSLVISRAVAYACSCAVCIKRMSSWPSVADLQEVVRVSGPGQTHALNNNDIALQILSRIDYGDASSACKAAEAWCSIYPNVCYGSVNHEVWRDLMSKIFPHVPQDGLPVIPFGPNTVPVPLTKRGWFLTMCARSKTLVEATEQLETVMNIVAATPDLQVSPQLANTTEHLNRIRQARVAITEARTVKGLAVARYNYWNGNVPPPLTRQNAMNHG